MPLKRLVDSEGRRPMMSLVVTCAAGKVPKGSRGPLQVFALHKNQNGEWTDGMACSHSLNERQSGCNGQLQSLMISAQDRYALLEMGLVL